MSFRLFPFFCYSPAPLVSSFWSPLSLFFLFSVPFWPLHTVCYQTMSTRNAETFSQEGEKEKRGGNTRDGVKHGKRMKKDQPLFFRHRRREVSR
ncbi:uncharacterized protein B0T23DRAFT_386162 [Neurospora hispaniola]|uniref:Uncharacterized protein n=1 Tax=Neurospora hispaniola TaxID=588809 RepID=A0AAJ0MNI9_9PEZI|nr:hypothetical protein B0T23DRAFT_386162 [Neurospora hispaniola]